MKAYLKSKCDLIGPFLEELPIFNKLSNSLKSEIVYHSDFINVPKGKHLFQEEDEPNGGYVVATGRVVLSKVTSKGKRIVTQLLGRGDPLGFVCASQGRPYPLSATALCESVVLHINQECLPMIKRKAPAFQSDLMRICSNRMQDSHELIARLVDSSSSVRIANALLLFANKFAEEVNGGVLRVEVSRQQLSNVAATTVETCIRVTRTMMEQGILAFPQHKVIDIIDRDSLKQMAAA